MDCIVMFTHAANSSNLSKVTIIATKVVIGICVFNAQINEPIKYSS